MVLQWPQEGHGLTYAVEVDLDGRAHLVCEMTVPGHMPDLHMATPPVGRIGGDTPADLDDRRRLFAAIGAIGAIGAITVTGGHVEAPCKRLLLSCRSEGGFSDVDKTWTVLHDMLQEEAASLNNGERDALRSVLEWGAAKRVKWHRDNAVHSYWWLHDSGQAIACRFFRKEDGTQILSSLKKLEALPALVFAYAEKLDALLSDHHRGWIMLHAGETAATA